MPTERIDVLRQALVPFVRCRQGSTAIEYALIAGGIAVAIVAVLASVGDAVELSYESVVGSFPE